jgi:hypothetical protein|tara:strand:+ start:190 stop:645 length:456 start_codon:yes stop_codon:yes gene_type:complete
MVTSSTAQELREESALQTSVRLNQQISLFDEQIIELESEFGPFDQSLLEPLQGLTGLHLEAGDFEEVSRLLNRRLHLLHILEGPFTLNQISVLTELITNDIRLQRWALSPRVSSSLPCHTHKTSMLTRRLGLHRCGGCEPGIKLPSMPRTC